jgi:hypothetical protein
VDYTVINNCLISIEASLRQLKFEVSAYQAEESPTISTNKPNATCLRCGHMEVCYYYKHSGGGCCGKFVPRTSHVD